MTAKEIKTKMLKKYKVGQEISLNFKSRGREKSRGKIKAKIIRSYPHHVLFLVDGIKESFDYWELNQLARR